jgi:hypothetical protein
MSRCQREGGGRKVGVYVKGQQSSAGNFSISA